MRFSIFLIIIGACTSFAHPNYAEEGRDALASIEWQQESPTRSECQPCPRYYYPCVYHNYWRYDYDQDACWPGKRKHDFYDYFTR